MGMLAKGLLQSVFLGLFSMALFTDSALAEAMTKNQYAAHWRDACVAKGKTKAITLTDHELSTIQNLILPYLAAYHSSLEVLGVPHKSLKLIVAEECGCIGAKIASQKNHLSKPTPNKVVDAAFDACGLD